ncbi:MAG: 2-oxo acid dehydrogenase subunit E2 [Planctomycetota bacterium]|jgi:pyruvate/2-oxoglutarate dehydrogenase complex dihydrolipoamide acyltransferase (E2) component|nr:2-oxo acid dehydrogenase subunit E2 [Planctomycetota bacterium]
MITRVEFVPDGETAAPRPALVEWLVGEGDAVSAGQPLCRYEVDKAIQIVESPRGGVARRFVVPEGARFSAGDTLLLLSDTADEELPGDIHTAHTPREKDIRFFDWSEIDNRAGPPEPLSVIRKAIADRMAMSKHHIPSFSLTAAVDMTGCLELRKSMKQTGGKATINDMAVKACAVALSRNPRVAAVYTPEGLIPRTDLNIGFAAALPDDGLVVPVVKNADKKPLAAIAAETRELAGKAKRGELTPADCSGGVFSVSYLGAFEVDSFTAIVNPGEAAILAVGKTVETPVVVDGSIAVRPIAKMTLSSDHRSIDGALAARLMDDVKRIMENPWQLL